MGTLVVLVSATIAAGAAFLVGRVSLHLQPFTLHLAPYTLTLKRCTLHTIHYTPHTAHCTLHTTHCTLHTTHYAWSAPSTPVCDHWPLITDRR